jgi:HAD superfamily hydrolase (TIGR01509 family)
MPLEDWLKNVGTADLMFDPVADLERTLGRAIDRDNDLAWRLQCELDLIAHQPPQPGVEAYLQAGQARGLKIGLASSSSCDWVTTHLNRLELTHYFDAIVASDDVRRTKPDPELYLTACEWLGVQPHEAVAFEDSFNGLRAAKRAGLYCVAVPTEMTRRMPFDAADLMLDSLAGLPLETLLSRLNGHRAP